MGYLVMVSVIKCTTQTYR